MSGCGASGQASGHGRSVIQGAVWEAAALLGSVSFPAGGRSGVRRAGEGVGGSVTGARRRDRHDLCLPGCRPVSAGPVPQTPAPLPDFTAPVPPPQSAMEGWFAEGGGARPVSSAPRQPALSGLHWGLLLLNYGGAPFGPISRRKSGRQAFT